MIKSPKSDSPVHSDVLIARTSREHVPTVRGDQHTWLAISVMLRANTLWFLWTSSNMFTCDTALAETSVTYNFKKEGEDLDGKRLMEHAWLYSD